MKKWAVILIWLGQLAVLVPPFYAWSEQLGWNYSDMTGLLLFPLLGMWAFSIMWYHFLVASIKRFRPKLMDYRQYYRLTGNVVLALILLHPTILYIEGKFSHFTVFDYVPQDKHLYVYFAFTAWTIFIGYEVIDRLQHKAWIQKHQQIIATINRLAFALIYFHGLNLGRHLQSGFMRDLWLFYGITTIIFFIYAYVHWLKTRQATVFEPHELA